MKSEDDMKIRGLAAGITILVTLFSLNLIIPPLAAGLETTPSPGTPTEPARYQKEELRQIVAPIALYPDPLLAQIFMASTYPIDVVLASRWLKEKGDLKDDVLDSALKDKEWDASVKSLVHFPEVLFLLNDNLEWTNKLGNAFLNQRKEVMEATQYLRQRAKEEGNLSTTPEQKVLTDDQVIRIDPAYPSVVYVPAYNPTVVYGPWYYPVTPWLVYPVRPWAYRVPFGFWWGYPNWVCYDIYIRNHDSHHHDRHHDGDHHHDGHSHHGDNHGKGYRGGKSISEGGWKKWQHDSTRGRVLASRDRSTVQHADQSFVRSREGRGDLQSYLQKAPVRQRQGAFQTRSREPLVTVREGRRDNRSYGMGSPNRQTQGRFQTGAGERISTFRGSSGSGLGRTEVPRMQLNTGRSSFQGGSPFQRGSSFQGGSRGGFGRGGFHR
jgi:hypothetical protein